MLHKKCCVAMMLFVFLLGINCGKDASLSPEESALFYRLRKIIYEENKYEVFTYSGELLTKVERFSDDQLTSWISFTYDQDSILLSEESYKKFSADSPFLLYQYSYQSNGHIDKAEVLSKNSQDEDYVPFRTQIFTTNEKSQIVMIEVWDSETQLYRSEFEYNSDGNIMRTKIFLFDALYQKEEYEYNAGLNPLYRIRNVIFSEPCFSKNTAKVSIRTYMSGEKNVNYMQSSYTYNRAYFPTSKKTCLFSASDTTELNIRYEY